MHYGAIPVTLQLDPTFTAEVVVPENSYTFDLHPPPKVHNLSVTFLVDLLLSAVK